MKRLWTILMTGFGLLMLAFTLGFGPMLFPGYEAGPKYHLSDAAKSLSTTRARIVSAPSQALEPPPVTWRNRVSQFFMLGGTDMMSAPRPERSELQQLRARASGQGLPGQMAVIRTDH